MSLLSQSKLFGNIASRTASLLGTVGLSAVCVCVALLYPSQPGLLAATINGQTASSLLSGAGLTGVGVDILLPSLVEILKGIVNSPPGNSFNGDTPLSQTDFSSNNVYSAVILQVVADGNYNQYVYTSNKKDFDSNLNTKEIKSTGIFPETFAISKVKCGFFCPAIPDPTTTIDAQVKTLPPGDFLTYSKSFAFVYKTDSNGIGIFTRQGQSAQAKVQPVPEPLTILGSVAAVGIGTVLKKQHSKRLQRAKSLV